MKVKRYITDTITLDVIQWKASAQRLDLKGFSS